MSQLASDVMRVQSRHGTIEAHRMGRAESGQSRWQIRFPWGTETFFGTSYDVQGHIQKRAAQQDGADRSGNSA